MNTDGSDRKTIVSDCHLPDGIVVDTEAGHIYWTNMGIPSLNDGSVERADIDGQEPQGPFVAGKHPHAEAIILDKKAGKLYCATARPCALCAAISTAHGWRRSSKAGRANR